MSFFLATRSTRAFLQKVRMDRSNRSNRSIIWRLAWQLITHHWRTAALPFALVVVFLVPGFVVVSECRAFRHDAQGNFDGPSARKASRFESIKEGIWLDKVRATTDGTKT
jgi:hypothetical protein